MVSGLGIYLSENYLQETASSGRTKKRNEYAQSNRAVTKYKTNPHPRILTIVPKKLKCRHNQISNAIYQEKASSMKSMLVSYCLRRTACRTSSLSAPGPQTDTPMVPTCASASIPIRVSMLGRPGNICTVDEGLWISFVERGRLTNSIMRSTSRRLSMARISVIHGRIHSRCSGLWMIHTRTTFLVATVPFANPVTRSRTWGTA